MESLTSCDRRFYSEQIATSWMFTLLVNYNIFFAPVHFITSSRSQHARLPFLARLPRLKAALSSVNATTCDHDAHTPEEEAVASVAS
jgi:hypothetical protein